MSGKAIGADMKEQDTGEEHEVRQVDQVRVQKQNNNTTRARLEIPPRHKQLNEQQFARDHCDETAQRTPASRGSSERMEFITCDTLFSTNVLNEFLECHGSFSRTCQKT